MMPPGLPPGLPPPGMQHGVIPHHPLAQQHPGFPQGVPQGIPQGMPQGIPQGVPHGVPVAGGMPGGLPGGLTLVLLKYEVFFLPVQERPRRDYRMVL